MTRDYAPTRPVRRTRLTNRARVALYVLAIAVSLLAGFTAEWWDPFARTVTP